MTSGSPEKETLNQGASSVSSDTQIFLVLDPLNIRLPPSILEFVVQVSVRLKTFSKLSPVFLAELNSMFPGAPSKSPFPQRLLEAKVRVEKQKSPVSPFFFVEAKFGSD